MSGVSLNSIPTLGFHMKCRSTEEVLIIFSGNTEMEQGLGQTVEKPFGLHGKTRSAGTDMPKGVVWKKFKKAQ